MVKSSSSCLVVALTLSALGAVYFFCAAKDLSAAESQLSAEGKGVDPICRATFFKIVGREGRDGSLPPNQVVISDTVWQSKIRFAKCDENKDGRIAVADEWQCYVDLFNEDWNTHYTTALNWDFNDDGFVDIEDIDTAAVAGFKAYDSNGDGKVSLAEGCKIMSKLNKEEFKKEI